MNLIHKIILYVFLFVLSVQVKAQSFKVTPSSIGFNLNAGESGSQTITVENTSDKVGSFVVSASDYDFDEDGKMRFMPPGTSKNSCSPYLTVTPSYITVNPNETVKVNVLMKVPRGPVKTSWGIVSIRAEREYTGVTADKDVVTAGLIITPEIAVKVLETPPGLTFQQMVIKDMVEVGPGEGGPTRVFQVKIANEGEVKSKAKLYLTASNYETLHEITTEPVEVNVLPGVNAFVKLPLPGGLPSGAYSLAAIMDYGAEYDLEGIEMEIQVREEGPQGVSNQQEGGGHEQ